MNASVVIRSRPTDLHVYIIYSIYSESSFSVKSKCVTDVNKRFILVYYTNLFGIVT